MTEIIEVNRVSYAHPVPGGTPHPALRDISFSINQGEHIAIVGANGSGKTTLARHLNALLIPDSGNIRIMDLDTKDRSNHMKIHQHVGIVFQLTTLKATYCITFVTPTAKALCIQ